MHVVYFSPVAWNSIEQRPQEFVRWLNLRYGASVEWIEPYPTRLPALGDFMALGAESAIPLQESPDWLKIWKPGWLPIEPIPGSVRILSKIWRNFLWALGDQVTKDSVVIIGKPSKLATLFTEMFRTNLTVFDMMDNFEAFYVGLSSKSMALNTKDALATADLVVFSSDPLSTKYSNQSKNSTIILNAHNHERFAVAPRPKESASPQHPVFGYVGTLGSWFDWNLVIELSEQAPHSSIPLIGPVYTKPRRPLPSNIHLLGPMSNSQAISHMRGFSAGLIPFKINELTDYVDPIKYYEYRTLGLPVFSSSFGQMRERGPNNGVWKMSSGEIGSLLVDFANQLPPGHSSNSSHVPDWSSRLSASKLADLLDSQNRR